MNLHRRSTMLAKQRQLPFGLVRESTGDSSDDLRFRGSNDWLQQYYCTLLADSDLRCIALNGGEKGNRHPKGASENATLYSLVGYGLEWVLMGCSSWERRLVDG